MISALYVGYCGPAITVYSIVDPAYGVELIAFLSRPADRLQVPSAANRITALAVVDANVVDTRSTTAHGKGSRP
jgi:hypothetical protein